MKADQPNTIKRVRLDYLEIDQGAKLELHWTKPDGTAEILPGQFLKPRYGLATSSHTPDTDGVPDQRTATRYNEGIDAVYGLVTSSSTDPAGLNLTQRTEYEQTGFKRRTTKTLPNGSKSPTPTTPTAHSESIRAIQGLGLCPTQRSTAHHPDDTGFRLGTGRRASL